MNNPFKLILIDDDPIFRLGLCTALESFPDLRVVAQADIGAAAMEIIGPGAGTENAIDLVVLEVDDGRSYPLMPATPPYPAQPPRTLGGQAGSDDGVVSFVDYPPQPPLGQEGQAGVRAASNQGLAHQSPPPLTKEGQGGVGLQLCQQLKTQYPTMPVFLLSSTREPALLAAARATGVEGYCPKGTSLSELVAAMRLVAAGQTYWPEVITQASAVRSQKAKPFISHVSSFIAAIGQPGLRQIDATLTSVTAQLQNSNLSKLDWLIVSGRRRELLAARWLVNQLLPPTDGFSQQSVVINYPSPVISHLPQTSDKGQMTKDKEPDFFEATLDKLQSGLQNLTGVPMEIDILREEKKRELLYIILRKLEDLLDELRFSQVQPSQLPQKRSRILQDLWQASTTDFFGKYYTLQQGNREFEVISVLLQDVEIVREAILDKIAQFVDFFSHLLFHTPLVIDNTSYSFGTPEARERGEYLLENILIKIANSVVQPLLNHFADVEVIKQTFYDRRLLSSREIARFRNNLSWKYRLERYIIEPTAIFESRYSLFVLSGTGIKQISIYAPRNAELEQLTGIQLAVTLVLETRDAIAPRLRSTIAFVGRGVVYLLTQVIGRGIGLIGRGIIQGIGNSLQDTRFGKNNEREK